MILSLDMYSDTPIYTQLCQQIIKAIALEELKPGDDLPSVRSLAADIGVNLHTINKAYNALKAEGFLVVNRRKGVMVNDPNLFKANQSYKERLSKELEVIMIESMARGLEYNELQSIMTDILVNMKGE